jgi:alpha-tubulin suppressor-like RCC1 family protein
MAVTVPSPYIQYGGIWTASQQADAKAAGTWPVPPAPKLYSWGVNSQGQLGIGNTTAYSSPKQIGSLTNWSNISFGNAVCLSTKTDGTLWAWGQNNLSTLGVGDTINRSSPTQVGALTNWSSLSANGYFASFAIKTDGTLWSWGYNAQGQLGLGNTTYSFSSPQQVGSLTNWRYVNSGVFNVFSIKTDGTLWTWGASQGDFGQAGTGTGAFSASSPVQVGALTDWLLVSSAQYMTASIKTNGTLWTWGRNNFGQLGLGNTTNYSSPKQVGALTNWLNVVCKYNSILAVKTDGTLWSWGVNSAGQLGLGNTTNYSSPKQIGALTGWSKVSIGYSGNAFAIKNDGTLWAWGANGSGQLGTGNLTGISSPVQVGTLASWINIAGGNSANGLGIARN